METDPRSVRADVDDEDEVGKEQWMSCEKEEKQ